MPLRTPLYDRHVALGARMAEFAGYDMPIQYAGILKEHHAVRTAAGLFDVSHMGEIWIRGADAVSSTDRLICNSLANLRDGQILYSPLTNANGGIVDDILIYRISQQELFLVVNASNTDKDFAHIQRELTGNATAENASADFGQLALQGPQSRAILSRCTDFDLSQLRFFRFARNVKVAGVDVLLSRSGYTGEDGFELYIPQNDTAAVWDALLEAGADLGIMSIGLGARDTLRMEAALPLYGHELADDISPIEAGLQKFVKLDADDFLGRSAMLTPAKRKLIGLKVTGRGVPRGGYAVTCNDVPVGAVTSGGFAPSLEANIAMALIDADCDAQELAIVIRDIPTPAHVVSLPFYSKKYQK